MASTGRIYGTSGSNITAGGNAWTNAANVDGAASGDYATTSCEFPADASDYLATSIAATPIDGAVTSVTLGCRIKTDLVPVPSTCSVTISLFNSAGTQLGHATINSGFGTTEADIEARLGLLSGSTFADIKAAVEAGITKAAGPKGLTVAVSNFDGDAIEFSLASVWLDVSYAKGPIYQDASPSAILTRTILVDVINP